MAEGFSLSDTAARLEAKIRAHRPLEFPAAWHDELIFPCYDGLSLRNVPRTIARLLGASALADDPLDEAVWGGQALEGQIDRVVLFLSDGLGYLWLKQLMAEDADLVATVAALSDGRGPLPLTSVAPSTTVAALTTLWTGHGPASHGVVGLTMFLREFSMVGSMLSYAPVTGEYHNGDFERWGLDPATFVPLPSLAETLDAAGVPTHLLLQKNLMGSGLSKILHRGAKHRHVHGGYSDVWLRLHEVLSQTAGQRCYVSVYYPGVDNLAHLYGAHTRYVRHEVKGQLSALRDLLASDAVRDGRTLFLFLADHGHHDTPRKIHVSKNRHFRPIREALRAQGGEPRLAYLYLRDGQKQTVIETVEEHFAHALTWIESRAALEAGLFGPEPPHAEVPHRLGDLMLTPRLKWRLDAEGVPRLVGWHGGFADWEMLVPLLWKRL